jgi:hypothetical protein
MKTNDVLQHIYALYNDLKIFSDYTKQYTCNNKMPPLQDTIKIPNLSGIEKKNSLDPEDTLHLFVERSCAVCKYLFQTSLWEFLQKLCHRLSLRLELHEIDQKDLESKAFSKGVYDIYRVPTLLYRSKLYIVNPAEEEGEEPHGTVIRELLAFFGVLGLLNYEFIDGEKPLDPSRSPSPDTIVIRRKAKGSKPIPPKSIAGPSPMTPAPEKPAAMPPPVKEGNKGIKDVKESGEEKESKKENNSLFL